MLLVEARCGVAFTQAEARCGVAFTESGEGGLCGESALIFSPQEDRNVCDEAAAEVQEYALLRPVLALDLHVLGEHGRDEGTHFQGSLMAPLFIGP
jgi:hypothetical protein